MKRTIILITALMLALSFFSVAFADTTGTETTGNINIFLGQKQLDEDDWKGDVRGQTVALDKHSEFGFELDIADKSWPISIAVGMLGSSKTQDVSGRTLKGNTSEFNFGVKKIFSFDNSSTHPFVGGGISLMSAEIEGDNDSVNGTGTGLWLAGGVYWTLDGLNIGLEARVSRADVEMADGLEVAAGGEHFGLLFGFHW